MTENKKNDTTLVNFRVDPVVKESAEAVLSGMGLNMSSYIGLCLRQLAQERTVPFTLAVDPKFWAAEEAVSSAMRIIEAGQFERAVEVDKDLSKKMTSTFAEFLSGEGSIPIGLVGERAEELDRWSQVFELLGLYMSVESNDLEKSEAEKLLSKYKNLWIEK